MSCAEGLPAGGTGCVSNTLSNGLSSPPAAAGADAAGAAGCGADAPSGTNTRVAAFSS